MESSVRQRRRVPRGAACAAILFAIAACAGPSDERRIAQLFEEAAAALEAGRVDDAAGHLSDDYRDAAGRTKRALTAIAHFALRDGPVKIWLRPPQIEVRGDEATAHLEAFALQTAGRVEELADLIPHDARRLQLEARLCARGGRGASSPSTSRTCRSRPSDAPPVPRVS